MRTRYSLLNGGEVALDFEKDVQAVIPQWDSVKGHYARVIATNGVVYNVKGEGHRVRT